MLVLEEGTLLPPPMPRMIPPRNGKIVLVAVYTVFGCLCAYRHNHTAINGNRTVGVQSVVAGAACVDIAAIDDNTISGIDTVVFGKTLNNTIVNRQVVGFNALGTTARTGDICTSTCNQDGVGFESFAFGSRNVYRVRTTPQ